MVTRFRIIEALLRNGSNAMQDNDGRSADKLGKPTGSRNWVSNKVTSWQDQWEGAVPQCCCIGRGKSWTGLESMKSAMALMLTRLSLLVVRFGARPNTGRPPHTRFHLSEDRSTSLGS